MVSTSVGWRYWFRSDFFGLDSPHAGRSQVVSAEDLCYCRLCVLKQWCWRWSYYKWLKYIYTKVSFINESDKSYAIVINTVPFKIDNKSFTDSHTCVCMCIYGYTCTHVHTHKCICVCVYYICSTFYLSQGCHVKSAIQG